MRVRNVSLTVFMLVAALLVAGCQKTNNTKPSVADLPSSEQPAGDESQEVANNQPSDSIQNPSGEYTILELLNMKKPMKCSWKQEATKGDEVTNIMYLDNGKFYQDVTMGDMGHAYTINDGEYLYIWNDFTNLANKIKADDAAAGTGTPEQGQTGLNLKHDFVCENWSVDSSVFKVPADKNFEDITEEMTGVVKDLQENSDKYKQQACDMCRKAPTQELIDNCLQGAECE